MGKKRISRLTVLSVILFVLVVVWFIVSVGNAGNAADKKRTDSVYSSVMNGAVLCYSIEGEYPADLDYLKENYGVIVDSDRYVVDYRYFGANIRPTVVVAEKTEG
ncbi:MAG: hypothetical protein IJZ61_07600 [Oscillospiraceae bacterium]|nr:hypothetical protein [Oscillospiraceae bacterium]